jgi:predicted amidohydrolase YtcJ
LDHRHRLEHCSVCPPDLVQRLKSLGAMVVTQPLFLYYGAERYLETVPPEQLKYLYPVGSWAESGVAVATGSDAPVVPLNSLAGTYAAVARRAQTGQLLGPDQGVLVEKALEIHTLAGAYASFEEGVKGSISPGKLADIAVLSNDPTRVPLESLKDIEVLMTVIDGQVVWER